MCHFDHSKHLRNVDAQSHQLLLMLEIKTCWEENHQTIENPIQDMLIGGDRPTKFWSHDPICNFWIFSFPPSADQTSSPIQITTTKEEDWTCLGTFGCRVLVGSLVGRSTKFKSNAKKNRFLGFSLITSKMLIWCDCFASKPEDECIDDHPVFNHQKPTPPLEAPREFMVDDGQPKITNFVNDSHGSGLRTRKSITRFVFTFCAGAVIC